MLYDWPLEELRCWSKDPNTKSTPLPLLAAYKPILLNPIAKNLVYLHFMMIRLEDFKRNIDFSPFLPSPNATINNRYPSLVLFCMACKETIVKLNFLLQSVIEILNILFCNGREIVRVYRSYYISQKSFKNMAKLLTSAIRVK